MPVSCVLLEKINSLRLNILHAFSRANRTKNEVMDSRRTNSAEGLTKEALYLERNQSVTKKNTTITTATTR